MIKKIIYFLFIGFCIVTSSTLCNAAPQDNFVFTNSNQQQRFESITKTLRCLVCQNQSLADSQADLANDLRGKIYHMLSRGNTDQEIYRYMVDRYGEFILYKPQMTANTFALWFAPLGFLLLGVLLTRRYFRKKLT